MAREVSYRGTRPIYRVLNCEEESKCTSSSLLDPDKALGPPKETPEEFRARILLAAAMKLYEGGRISSDGAARLARIPRRLLLTKLADLGSGHLVEIAKCDLKRLLVC